MASRRSENASSCQVSCEDDQELLKEALTQQKVMEKALRESEAKFRCLFDNSMDAILLTEPDGTVLSANPASGAIWTDGTDDGTTPLNILSANGPVDQTS